MKSNHRLTVSFSVLMLLSLGCSFVTQLFSGQDSEKREVSHEPPTLPAPPKPASVAEGTSEEQAVSFADLLASGDSDTRLAGWMGVYDALGVPVIGQDGVPLGTTGDDPFGPRYWHLWYASGLDRPGRGIPLRDAGRLIAAGLPDVDGIALAQLLLDDLRLAAQSEDAQVRLMGLFVRERILRGPSHVDLLDTAVTPDMAVIDLPTVQLLSWIILRVGLFEAISQAAVSKGSHVFVDYHPQPPQEPFAQAEQQASCSDLPGAGSDTTYWANWIINQLGGGFELPGMQKAFPGLIERAVGKAFAGRGEKFAESASETGGKVAGYANVIISAISFIMQLEAMEITPFQDPAPLERTHEDRNPGKEGTLELQLNSFTDELPDGDALESCLASFALNALGVSFSFPSNDPIAGAEISVKGGQGFPDLVLFDTRGTNSLRADTDSNGFATFKIFGAPQKRTIPESAKPVIKTFSVIVSAQPEAVTGNTIADIFFGGLTFGAAPSGSGGLSTLIDILKTFSYDMGEYVFELTDWALPGYKAEDPYSGVICSLEQPFTITGTWMVGAGIANMQFTPSSPQAGSMSGSGEIAGAATWSEEGNYTVQEGAHGNPYLDVVGTMCLTAESFSECNDSHRSIDLVPLDTDECSQP